MTSDKNDFKNVVAFTGNSENITPRQILLDAMEHVDEMEEVIVMYVTKETKTNPTEFGMSCSDIRNADMLVYAKYLERCAEEAIFGPDE